MGMTVRMQLRHRSGETLTPPDDLGLKYLPRKPRRGAIVEFEHAGHVTKARVADISAPHPEDHAGSVVTVLAEEL